MWFVVRGVVRGVVCGVVCGVALCDVRLGLWWVQWCVASCVVCGAMCVVRRGALRGALAVCCERVVLCAAGDGWCRLVWFVVCGVVCRVWSWLVRCGGVKWCDVRCVCVWCGVCVRL